MSSKVGRVSGEGGRSAVSRARPASPAPSPRSLAPPSGASPPAERPPAPRGPEGSRGRGPGRPWLPPARPERQSLRAAPPARSLPGLLTGPRPLARPWAPPARGRWAAWGSPRRAFPRSPGPPGSGWPRWHWPPWRWARSPGAARGADGAGGGSRWAPWRSSGSTRSSPARGCR